MRLGGGGDEGLEVVLVVFVLFFVVVGPELGLEGIGLVAAIRTKDGGG